MRAAIHLHPTAPLAGRVLLPGDPGRALRLAQQLMPAPRMFNHNRGLWGYSGEAHAGALLTIQSTGMGGPSAAIVASELIDLGAQRILRIGTCGALVPSLSLGQLLIASEALCEDGTSRALGAGPRALPSASLLQALLAAPPPSTSTPAGEPRTPTLVTVADGPVVSTDLFYDADDLRAEWAAAGALAVEMEAAALFTVAGRRGAEAGCVLLVSDLLASEPESESPSERVRIDAEALHAAEVGLGELALAALTP